MDSPRTRAENYMSTLREAHRQGLITAEGMAHYEDSHRARVVDMPPLETRVEHDFRHEYHAPLETQIETLYDFRHHAPLETQVEMLPRYGYDEEAAWPPEPPLVGILAIEDAKHEYPRYVGPLVGMGRIKLKRPDPDEVLRQAARARELHRQKLRGWAFVVLCLLFISAALAFIVWMWDTQ